MKEEKDVEEEETGKISTGTSTDATIPYGTQHPHEINYNNSDSSNLVMMPPNNSNQTLIQHYDPTKVSVASTRSRDNEINVGMKIIGLEKMEIIFIIFVLGKCIRVLNHFETLRNR
ncbi:hypothetical protein PV325_001962 [Microctonus aethiopoides]|nr:hypothetical protein PV325_001962 [Microctonus aethiopoides]